MLRRVLLGALVAVAALGVLRAHASLTTVELDGRSITFDCPIADGSDWYYDASVAHADRVETLVLPRKSFLQTCQPPWPQPAVAACATLGGHPDNVYGGHYAIIYTASTPSAMPESLLVHELCHTQGWAHGLHYGK